MIAQQYRRQILSKNQKENLQPCIKSILSSCSRNVKGKEAISRALKFQIIQKSSSICMTLRKLKAYKSRKLGVKLINKVSQMISASIIAIFHLMENKSQILNNHILKNSMGVSKIGGNNRHVFLITRITKVLLLSREIQNFIMIESIKVNQ